MGKVFTLAMKDLRLLLRDKASVFWVIGFPLLYAIFFGSIYSGMGGGGGVSEMKLIVVDRDSTEQSRNFVEGLSESSALRVTTSTLDSARNLVRRGKAPAYLDIAPGYGEATGFGVGGSPQLELGIDPARKAEIGYLKGLIIQSSFMQLQKRMTDPVQMREQLSKSIESIDQDTARTKDLGSVRQLLTSLDRFYGEIEADTTTDSQTTEEIHDAVFGGPQVTIAEITDDRARPNSSFEITFPLSILWALLGCAAMFGISIVQERVHGTYLRLCIAPISRAHILAGKGLACFITCLAVCLLMLILGNLVFGVRIDYPIKMALAIVAAILCFVGLMMVVSVLGKTEQSVSGVGWAVMLLFTMIGGGMIPLAFMPSWLQSISNISPVKWGILAIEGAVWREFSYSEMLLPVGILLGFGLAAFTLGVVILKRHDS